MIKTFDGEYGWLSNFYPSEIKAFGGDGRLLVFPSVEHYYQAMKSDNPTLWLMFVSGSPGQAKKNGRKLVLRENWNDIKLYFMESGLRAKFADSRMANLLLSTDGEMLVEGNTWHDNYWGICHCGKCEGGLNNLGRLLMKIREDLRGRQPCRN